MDIAQPTGDGHPATQLHSRNDELFARRKELSDRIAELRAKAEAGDLDEVSEAALRRDERELDDLTSEIMAANYGLVRRYVAMFTSRSSQHSEDFQSAGKVGLLWAIASYDPARGSFASWAFKPIQREVLRAVRDADHPNLNLSDFEKRPAILAAERAFLEDHGADAVCDHAEIARRAGVTEAQVHRVLDAPRLESLQAPIGGQGEDTIPWEDRLPDPSSSIEDQVQLRFHLRALINHGLPNLNTRELYVLTRRFGLDGEEEQPLRVIGEQLGLSREGVRQIQQKALAKLNEPIADAV
ncbi:sigma-70 family RNA polymerase sigma factor [Actinomadura sp. LD22]|uniref:Sigma-70 family RNA polymerase sigma factor n=1 Tax=Actinomadura physcomitrii TaxID=2650748 RepID=A0A6I4MLG3_9ACTN|nr:sigma-70 family RNA polymerase sigma factor [Actinomadura physcomitrii]MWA07058.1 sigma-70 family RNA polymerase sigma factor [Actinomadura physcomitrii]